MTEKQIQDHIWDNRKDFCDMLEDFEFPEPQQIDNPSNLTPDFVLYNQALDRTKRLYDSIYNLDFFGCEVSLKKDLDSTIRADFLGILGGRNGLTVVELKKSRQTERQAFTEMMAYGGHLRTEFAPMSKMDIAYVLISPMEERIVREATINALLYEGNNVIALIPKCKDDDVTTLKLFPWIPSLKEVQAVTSACFSQKNFDVFKVTWDALEGDWSPENDGESPDQTMIDRLNKVSAYAAQLMESKGIHGFVYSSQGFPELRGVGHLLNAIVLVGINPYKSTKNRFLVSQGLTEKKADEIPIDAVSMADVIPEIAKRAKEEKMELDHLRDLSMTWNNEIMGIGFEVVDVVTKSKEREWVETGHGGFDWETFQEQVLEDVYCHSFDIRLTGLLREVFVEYSKMDYDFIRQNGLKEHLQYADEGIPDYFVDMMTEHHYVRRFLQRLFNPNFEIEDWIDEEESGDEESGKEDFPI